MLLLSVWITGSTRTGKTSRLVEEFNRWVKQKLSSRKQFTDLKERLASAVLVLAANDDNRRNLADRLSTAIAGSYPVVSKTPLGFIYDEVVLFWPLIFSQLNLKAQFPLRLRPETEQELATQLWQPYLETSTHSQSRLVRRYLDLLQLAGASGIEIEQIPLILEQGLSQQETLQTPEQIGEMLTMWQEWCLKRGLLTYGIIYELYWRYLLKNQTYQRYLARRYQAVFADDVDDYPAIAFNLLQLLLTQNAFGVFTYNQDAQVRLGLGADPNYLARLAFHPQIEVVDLPHQNQQTAQLQATAVSLVSDPTFMESLPTSIRSIQTVSRAELLRKTADRIIKAVTQEQVKPAEIAVIAPGLDEIARYTLIEILSHRGIAVEPLNEQRPLISSPLVRALLTMLTLVYPGLGRLVNRDAVAEMLVILSQKPQANDIQPGRLNPEIDPVRAGLLADYCFKVDLENPRLLGRESFPRWDRLGHRATNAYQEISEWLEWVKSLRQQQHLSTITLLNAAIERFLLKETLAYDQLAALRELMETAQHYWEVDQRLRQNEPNSQPPTATVAQFIELLRQGTITANPRPVSYLGRNREAVTLATIFQYRSLRSFHPWQFWLDTGSILWEKGGAATLFAAPLFEREWSGRRWMPEDQIRADQERLQRILRDLLGRVGERVYLCYSDLGVNGSEQTGPLLPLVYASRESESTTHRPEADQAIAF